MKLQELKDILNESEMLLLELGDSPYPWRWTREPAGLYKSGEATFEVDNDTFNVQLGYRSDKDRTQIFWDKNNKFDGESDTSAVRIIFTIMDVIRTYITQVRPKYIIFTANKGSGGRDNRNKLASLYSSVVKKFAVKLGYSTEIENDGHEAQFMLTRRDKKLRMEK
jgi:hypothetical protein